MMNQNGDRTFVVKILNNQNATWQGTVAWTDGRKQETFRSALELIRLLDSAVNTSLADEADEAAL